VHLILSITVFTTELNTLKPTVLFVDQLSASLPLLKWLISKPVFFYCHFPDKLLAQGRDSWLKRLYRGPFDVLEEYSMEWADAVAVNSEFTRGVLAREWPTLVERGDVRVVYPSISLEEGKKGEKVEEAEALWKKKRVLLSVNRFERKKDVALAIKAFAALDKGKRKDARLVIAGESLSQKPPLSPSGASFTDKHYQEVTTPVSPKMHNTTPSSRPSPPP
jgi:alpha-1,3/alpha-1,6-mannosyltransferase